MLKRIIFLLCVVPSMMVDGFMFLISFIVTGDLYREIPSLVLKLWEWTMGKTEE